MRTDVHLNELWRLVNAVTLLRYLAPMDYESVTCAVRWSAQDYENMYIGVVGSKPAIVQGRIVVKHAVKSVTGVTYYAATDGFSAAVWKILWNEDQVGFIACQPTNPPPSKSFSKLGHASTRSFRHSSKSFGRSKRVRRLEEEDERTLLVVTASRRLASMRRPSAPDLRCRNRLRFSAVSLPLNQ